MDATSGSIKLTPNTETRNLSLDRILVLKPIAGAAKDSHGLTDPQLFTGGNRLHAIMDRETCLWHMAYDHGMLPPPLKQQFTSFSMLMRHVEAYFKTRNIEIVEIIQ